MLFRSGIVSQRLLPRICNYCAAPASAEDEAIAIATRIGLLEGGFKQTIRRGRGCEKCRETGRSGRVAVFEMLAVDDRLRPLIESSAGVSEIRSQLTPNTFLPLEKYAGMLLVAGVISPESAISLFPKVRQH